MNNNLISARDQARDLDQQDPLRHLRDEFWIPTTDDGREQLYFCGNSLGLQPKSVEAAVQEELDAWKNLAVEGHFKGRRPWLSYNEILREPMAELVGATPLEVVFMNTLTVNLHLLMISFYRPAGKRNRIVIEAQCFPSDRYAVESQIRLHGLDPAECLVEIAADEKTRLVDETALEAYLEQHGENVALVLWPGVQYASGQVFDLERIAAAARKSGARCGFDLAHAVGNVPIDLKKSGADFASWCTYKYLNSGQGAIAAGFVHERHSNKHDIMRLNGWWGNDEPTRFLMTDEFVPASGAAAWQISNPPILAMAPIRASLAMFAQVGMKALRAKSVQMTGFLENLVQTELHEWIEIITPPEAHRRGCQLSLRVRAGRQKGRQLFDHLEASGTIPDWREPDIIRVSPVPLYNRYEDCWLFVHQVKQFMQT